MEATCCFLDCRGVGCFVRAVTHRVPDTFADGLRDVLYRLGLDVNALSLSAVFEVVTWDKVSRSKDPAAVPGPPVPFRIEFDVRL